MRYDVDTITGAPYAVLAKDLADAVSQVKADGPALGDRLVLRDESGRQFTIFLADGVFCMYCGCSESNRCPGDCYQWAARDPHVCGLCWRQRAA